MGVEVMGVEVIGREWFLPVRGHGLLHMGATGGYEGVGAYEGRLLCQDTGLGPPLGPSAETDQ